MQRNRAEEQQKNRKRRFLLLCWILAAVFCLGMTAIRILRPERLAFVQQAVFGSDEAWVKEVFGEKERSIAVWNQYAKAKD